LSLRPPPVLGVCVDGVAGWPLLLPVLRVSFSPGGMLATAVNGVRPREKSVLLAVDGSPGASQTAVLMKDERRGGASVRLQAQRRCMQVSTELCMHVIVESAMGMCSGDG
jgi:hypothetical protein